MPPVHLKDPAIVRPAPKQPASPAASPKPANRVASASTAQAKTLDAFEASKPPRDPAAAADFVKRFDARLGLPATVLKARTASMSSGTLAFFQANPALFYRDLEGPFRSLRELLPRAAPRITIDGDSHLANFGTTRGPGGEAVWGLNDFDQSGTGSPEWDLERLTSSVVLAARANGLSAADQQKAASAVGQAYFKALRSRAEGKGDGLPFLTEKKAKGKVEDLIEEASERKRQEFLAEYTKGSGDKTRFLKNEELLKVKSPQDDQLEAALAAYGKGLTGTKKVKLPLNVLDLAEKQGSGGSTFGLPRYYALVEAAGKGKAPILLELKQCLPPPFDGQPPDLAKADGGEVVGRARELGGLLNPLSGEVRVNGRDFLVRELEPEKDRIKPQELKTAADLQSVASQAARALAFAHTHAPGNAQKLQDWVGNDAPAATQKLVAFGLAYADQVEADLAALKAR